MGAQIAGYSFTAWSGTVPPMANAIEARERAGTDGYTFVLRGKRSPAFEVRTTSLHADIGTARGRCTDYERLIGTFVTLEDAAGRSYGRVIVLGVTARAYRLLYSTDGSHAAVECSWSLQRGR
jgi:hypothetical protein